MQQTTVEYIVAYKKGEVVFEGDYPLVVFENNDEEIIQDKILGNGYSYYDSKKKKILNKLYKNYL